MKKTAPDGLNWMIQAPCLLMRLRDYLKNKDKIRTKIRTKKTAPAGRTTRRMDFNPETLSKLSLHHCAETLIEPLCTSYRVSCYFMLPDFRRPCVMHLMQFCSSASSATSAANFLSGYSGLVHNPRQGLFKVAQMHR